MTDEREDAITFEEPPVSEVVFSVIFDQSAGAVIDEVRTLSKFWAAEVQERYPTPERQPPLGPVSETFDLTPVRRDIQILPLEAAPPFRYWFISQDQTRVVQVQADRLSLNWRNVDGAQRYPRYEVLAPEYFGLFDRFQEHATIVGGAGAWCELSYVNAIPTEEGTTHGQLARILRDMVPDPRQHEYLPPVEDTALQERFRIVEDGQPVGRLYLTATPAIDPDSNRPVYLLTLLVRRRMTDLTQAAELFNAAHDLIVHSFVELTTDDLQQRWGRVD